MTYVTDSEHAQVKNFHKTLEEKSKRLQDPNESENSQRILEKEKYMLKWKEHTKALELIQGLQTLMSTRPDIDE